MAAFTLQLIYAALTGVGLGSLIGFARAWRKGWRPWAHFYAFGVSKVTGVQPRKTVFGVST